MKTSEKVQERNSEREDRRRSRILERQLRDIEKQEQKILNQKENAFVKSKISPVMDKLQNMVPPKLKSALNTAFFKGFHLVFEKGNDYIEKTYDKDRIRAEFDMSNYAVDRAMKRKHIRKLDRQSGQTKTLNASISALEGGVLGLLGIGLPDIPLFIAVILRTVNEIALSYGYQYETDQEKAYMLYLISGAMSKDDTQKEFDRKVEMTGEMIDKGGHIPIDLEEIIRETSDALSDALLTAKFVQGLPLIGVVGGVINPAVINKIGRYAGIKYKKRYLLGKTVDQK